MDERLEPYAGWLEGFLGALVALKPSKIGVVMLMEDGRTLTSFFGNVGTGEKGMMAYHIAADAFKDELLANAAEIIRKAMEQED